MKLRIFCLIFVKIPKQIEVERLLHNCCHSTTKKKEKSVIQSIQKSIHTNILLSLIFESGVNRRFIRDNTDRHESHCIKFCRPCRNEINHNIVDSNSRDLLEPIYHRKWCILLDRLHKFCIFSSEFYFGKRVTDKEVCFDCHVLSTFWMMCVSFLFQVVLSEWVSE
jgi:hypothetical protein